MRSLSKKKRRATRKKGRAFEKWSAFFDILKHNTM